MAIIEVTTGLPGSGKTYVRGARFVADFLLPETDLVYITNLPLNVEKICEFVALRKRGLFGFRRKKYSVESLKKRLIVLPPDLISAWRSGSLGPDEVFSSYDLRGCHIAIDEIHEILGDDKSEDYLKLWGDWLGTVRHNGCTIEFLTQDEKQVPRLIMGRCGIRREIVPCEDLRDPYLHIPLMDWYNLKAALFGSFHKTSFEVELRKTPKGTFKRTNTRRFLLLPEYFELYDSFNLTGREGAPPIQEYQKRGRVSFVFWFLRKNFWNIFPRLAIAIFFFWLCFCGGLSTLINCFMGVTQKIATSNSQKKKSSDVKKLQIGKSHETTTPVSSSKNEFNSSSSATADENIPAPPVSEPPDFSLYQPAIIFDDDTIFLRSGLRISKNYVFEAGSLFEGKKVIEINRRNRSYTLDDGFCLRMLPIRDKK